MSKTSLGGQYTLTASPVTLATLLGQSAGTLWKGQLALNGDRSYDAYIRFGNNPSDGSEDAVIAANVGFSHEFSAVDLSSVSVFGATAGDTVVLVGEGVEEDWGGRALN